MPRRFRFVALLALVVGAAVGLPACGSEDDPDAQELLRATFGPDQEVESGNLDVRLAFEGEGLAALQGPVSLQLTGPFETNGAGKLPSVDVELTLSGGGASLKAGAVTDGERGWIELQDTAYLVDDETFRRFREGYEAEAGQDGEDEGEDQSSFAALGIDPLRWLTDPKIAGEEKIGDTDTHHVTASVNVSAFLEDISELLSRAGELGQAAPDVPSSLTEQQRRDIESSVKGAVLDVWTGKDDKALRRLTLTVDIAVPADVRKRAGGLRTGRLDFSLAINDLNEEQEINGPADARPFSELQSLLTGGAPAAGTAEPGQSGGTPATPPADGESSEYLDCVAAAGNDVAEIQQCADLAGR